MIEPTFVSQVRIFNKIPIEKQRQAIANTYKVAMEAFILAKYHNKDNHFDFHIQTDLVGEDDESKIIQIRFYNTYYE